MSKLKLFDLNSINAFQKKAWNEIPKIESRYQKLETFFGMSLIFIPDFGRKFGGKGIHNKYVLMYAVEKSNLNFLEYALCHGSEALNDDVYDLISYACYLGKIDILDYFVNVGYLPNFENNSIERCYEAAILGAHDNIINYLNDITGHKCAHVQHLLTTCIKSGNVDFLVKMLSNVDKIKSLEYNLYCAIMSGNLSMVKAVLKLGLVEQKSIKPRIFEHCGESGSIEIANYFIDNHNLDYKKFAINTTLNAVRNNKLEFVKYLSGLGIDVATLPSNASLEMAAAKSDIEICKYLVSKGASMKASARNILAEAAFFGKEHIVEYLLELNPSFEQTIKAYGHALYGAQNCLPYLKAYVLDFVARSASKKYAQKLLDFANKRNIIDDEIKECCNAIL
jgi:ankyrin repeat protein